jgi:hypothetical protein
MTGPFAFPGVRVLRIRRYPSDEPPAAVLESLNAYPYKPSRNEATGNRTR